MKPIKVLQVGMTENIGGMETYLMEQYRHLDRKKIQYDFVNITGNSHMVYSDEILNNEDKIFSVCRRSLNPLKHYWDWFKILTWHRGEYAGIVLNACHLYYVFPMVLSRLMGIPHRIIHSHNNDDEIAIGIFRKCLITLNRYLLYWGATDYWACGPRTKTVENWNNQAILKNGTIYCYKEKNSENNSILFTTISFNT